MLQDPGGAGSWGRGVVGPWGRGVVGSWGRGVRRAWLSDLKLQRPCVVTDDRNITRHADL